MDSDSDSDPVDHPLGLLFRSIRHAAANHHPFGLFPIEDEERSASSDEDDVTFHDILQRIKENDPGTTELDGISYNYIDQITDEGWQEMGQDIANNTYLEKLLFNGGALNDHKIPFLFRGLTRSNSIKEIILYENGFSVAGIRSMVPFLQNANTLKQIFLDDNNIKSEGFNVLFQALRDSPIEYLLCTNCGIELIEINRNYIPQNLVYLCLDGNNVNADGCRGIAELLQDAALQILELAGNKIDDEGVEILVDALQNNSSLEKLDLRKNDDISKDGKIMLLKLVNDITSIQATLQSNHTLRYLLSKDINSVGLLNAEEVIQTYIDIATRINAMFLYNPERAGRQKVIQWHLHSERRADLAKLQGVEHSLYSEINPLHLPEVLSLIGERHGQGGLYAAVSSSIMTLLSTVNRKKCIQQERAYHAAIIADHKTKVEKLDAELGLIDAAEGNEGSEENEHRSNKRRRNWWWGLFGYGSA